MAAALGIAWAAAIAAFVPNIERIETERLSISPYRESDFESTLALYSDPEVTFFFEEGRPKTRKEVEKLVADMGEVFFKEHAPYGLYTIRTRGGEAFIGHIDYLPSGEKEAELGYILCKEAHGQGFATEALKEMVAYWASTEYIDQTCPPAILMATVKAENIGSVKVLEKIGMILENQIVRYGTIRQVYRMPLKRPG